MECRWLWEEDEEEGGNGEETVPHREGTPEREELLKRRSCAWVEEGVEGGGRGVMGLMVLVKWRDEKASGVWKMGGAAGEADGGGLGDGRCFRWLAGVGILFLERTRGMGMRGWENAVVELC